MGSGNSKATLDEQLRENKRQINKAIRELARERVRLQQSEKKIIADIKVEAQKGQMKSVRIMAQDLTRTRRHIQKFNLMESELKAVNLRLQSVKSTQALSESMKGVAKVMVNINKQMNVPEIDKIMREFIRESDVMEMMEDRMTDAVDSAIGDEEDDEEQEKVIAQVLDEIGIDFADKISNAPVGAIGSAAPATAHADAQRIPAGGVSPAPPQANQPSGLPGPDPVNRSINEMEKSLEQRLKDLNS